MGQNGLQSGPKGSKCAIRTPRVNSRGVCYQDPRVNSKGGSAIRTPRVNSKGGSAIRTPRVNSKGGGSAIRISLRVRAG